MRSLLPKVALTLFCGVVMVACKKKNEIDPVKEANNARIETQPPNLRAVQQSMNSSSGGYYVALPYLYDSTSKSYPLIVSIHGAGQIGNGTSNLPLVLYDGVPKVISAGNFPPNFEVNGKNYSFIMVAPQFTRYPANVEIKAVIDYTKKHYRIDDRRIYLTGLSMGGAVSFDAGAEFHTQVAAVVPVSGIPKDENNEKAKTIAEKKLPVWVFHNENDNVTNSILTRNYVELINSFSPLIAPRLTLFKAEGHDAWTQATNPAYKENGMNIYEWMLQYSR